MSTGPVVVHVRATITQGEVRFRCGLVVPYVSPEAHVSLPPLDPGRELPDAICPTCVADYPQK